MNKVKLVVYCTFLFLLSCSQNPDNQEKWKKEVVEAEQSFAKMALEKGIAEAFIEYASEDAVLSRNNEIISGIENIKTWFESRPQAEGSTLVWEPDFVDVSASGDLAYTYGKYTYTSLDSLGNEKKNSGIFHTVWKRQDDGNWKFVWD